MVQSPDVCRSLYNNASFDNQFLRAWFTQCGDNYFGSWFWYPPIDVMALAGIRLMHVRHELKDFKLGTVCEYFGIKPQGELHDAYVDIDLTEKLYRKLL